MNVKILFSQVNRMTPKPLEMKELSTENDFSFIEKMFWKTNNDIQRGIDEIKGTSANSIN